MLEQERSPVSVEHEGPQNDTRHDQNCASFILVIVAWSDGLAVESYGWPPFSLIRSTYKTVRPPQNVFYGI